MKNENENNQVKVRNQYTKSEKFFASVERNTKYLETDVDSNKVYWEEFYNNSGKSKGSLIQYKCTIFNFMEFVNKDICLVTKEDIDNFLATVENKATKENKTSHIKSILTFIVQNNTEDCLERISKETLILIISL